MAIQKKRWGCIVTNYRLPGGRCKRSLIGAKKICGDDERTQP